MNYRRCFVCSNDTENSPDKIFVRIRDNLREEWCMLANVEYCKKSGPLFSCEDHIDPYEDLENYFKVKLMKAEPKLKYDAKLRKVWDEEVTEHTTLLEESKTSGSISELERLLLIPEVPKPTRSKLKAQTSSHDENSRDGADGEENHSEIVDKSAQIVDVSTIVGQSEFADDADGSSEVDESDIADDESDIADDETPGGEESQIDEVEIKVEAELEDEFSAVPPDPLSYDLARACKDVTSHRPERTLLQLEDPITAIKEEFDFELAAESHAEDGKAAHTKLKEEIAILKTANFRLTNENQALIATNQSLAKRMHNLLQGNKELNNINPRSLLLNNLKIDNSLIEQHLALSTNIKTLKIENEKHVNRIKELLKKNEELKTRILDVNDRNKHLTDKISELINEKEVNKRKTEDINVFVKKIQILSEDVRRLTEENKLLEEKIRELEGRRDEEEIVEDRKKKERVKRKRK